MDPGDALTERICAAVEQARQSDQWRREEGRYAPTRPASPPRWLGGRARDSGRPHSGRPHRARGSARENAGRVYLVGDLAGEGLRDDEPTIQRRADGATLRYAPLARLAGQEADVAQVDLTVKVRHPPGAEVPGIEKVSERDRAAIDSRLRRYLP